MRAHRTLAILLCCALLLARGYGPHFHVALDHADHHAGAAMAEGPAHAAAHGDVVAVSDADHAERHLGHADVDVDLPDTTSGKLPSLPLLPALMALALVLLLSASRSGAGWAAYRPPVRPRRLHLQPPSQAPPLAS